MVCADTMAVLNTLSMEGYKHVLVLKHSDAKKVWAYGLRTKYGEEVLKCMKDFVEVQLTAYMGYGYADIMQMAQGNQ